MDDEDVEEVISSASLGSCASRVVTKQYLNGLFGSFDYFGPNKQTEFLQSVKQTISCVCLLV